MLLGRSGTTKYPPFKRNVPAFGAECYHISSLNMDLKGSFYYHLSLLQILNIV
jgi:hypothetical protein